MKAILLVATLFAAPAAAAPAVAWNKGTAIAITVTNDRFIPNRITLRQGRQYVLTLYNRSSRKHNFAAGSFFKYARVAPADAGWVVHDEVRLDPGQRAKLHIFAPATPNAAYTFRSTRLEDAVEKMKGTIYVQ